ncbi:MAG: TerB family tellurite resistance protein [Myxococcota bacterium]
MIIFGSRGVTSSGATGTFHCPTCGSGAPYRRKSVRRFFTLYFIPVIPLDKLADYVECTTCRGTFQPAVLDFDPTSQQAAFEAEFQRAVRGVAVKMMLADGVVEDDEVLAVCALLEKVTGDAPTPDRIRADAEAMRTDGRSVADYVASVRGGLNDRGKELVVRAALAIASSDGKISDTERLLLVEIGEALELTEAHLMGILQAAADA